MTAIDWAVNVGRHFRSKPAQEAFDQTIYELRVGLLGRYYHYHPWKDTFESELLGQPYKFTVESPLDVRRAIGLLGEIPVMEWLYADLSDTDVVWDIGAYHGHYSIVAASMGAYTVAFEPAEEPVTVLRRNESINNAKIGTLVRVALHNKTGKTGYINPQKTNKRVKLDENSDMTIDTIRGDEVGPAPTIVKLDATDAEIPILEGMPNHLEGVKRIAVETHDDHDVARVHELLSNAGLQTGEIPTNRSQTFVKGYR